MVRRCVVIARAAREVRHLSRQRLPLSGYCTQRSGCGAARKQVALRDAKSDHT